MIPGHLATIHRLLRCYSVGFIPGYSVATPLAFFNGVMSMILKGIEKAVFRLANPPS